MKHSNQNNGCAVICNDWRGSGATQGGQNARRTTKWRQVLGALSIASTRVHQYRNLRTSMFYDAMCKFECKD